MARTEALESWTGDQVAHWGHRWPGLPALPENAVVGVDGSPASIQAAGWAARLADRLHLVTALDVATIAVLPPEVPPPTVTWAEQIRQDVEAARPALDAAVAGCPVERSSREESPVRALLQAGADGPAGLLAIGHAGGGKMDRLLLGSVAETLIHNSPLPVLVARGPPGDGPILAGVADDPGTPPAAAWAARLALALDRELVLVHSLRGVDAAQPAGELGPRARFELLPWPARKGLQQAAEGSVPALVVVGHGKRGLGSTAVSLVRHAPCSVLVVPSPG